MALCIFNLEESNFVILGQISEKNVATRTETILNLVLAFHNADAIKTKI